MSREKRQERSASPVCSCGESRFRTVTKGIAWACRACGKIRRTNDRSLAQSKTPTSYSEEA